MTKQQAVEKLLDWARSQIGYAEGSNNYNKFAADSRLTQWLGWNAQNQPWCDIFADSCYLNAFGLEAAAKMTYQPIGAGSALCRASAQYYKNNNAWIGNVTPEPGDQIFFYYGGDINHTGVVESVSGGIVHTIEGNSSDRVQRCAYSVGTGVIAGYGRPDWSVVTDGTTKIPDVIVPKEPELTELKVGGIVRFTGDTHYAASDAARGFKCKPGLATVTILAPGAKHSVHLIAVSGSGSTVYGWVDEADIETKKEEKEPEKDPVEEAPQVEIPVLGLPELKNGSTGGTVEALQQLLIAKGYSIGVTRRFEYETVDAVKAFQAAKGIEADGICGNVTWVYLLGVIEK